MSVLSVPLTAEIERAIKYLIDSGVASNKADAARKAILKLEEDQALNVVLQSKQEYKEGKGVEGDLESIMKAF